jgi:hypothetical protein
MPRCALVFEGVPIPLYIEGTLDEVETKLKAAVSAGRLRWAIDGLETVVLLSNTKLIAVFEVGQAAGVPAASPQAPAPEPRPKPGVPS